MMADDRQLLRRFADDRSESAFGELVARHLPLVYSTAIRQTNGDVHLARDVAQLVFTDLARKARSLSGNIILAGWLHRATIFAARQILRGERRRQAREQQAATMNATETENEDWGRIRPLLDDALEDLNKTDRDALLLRFFEQRSMAEVGAHLGGTEDAARKRIARALEKVRAGLQRRGVTTSAALLTTVIAANAVQIPPAGLAATLTGVSLAAAGTGTAFTFLNIMTPTHIKLAVSALVVAGAATTIIVQHQMQSRLRTENQSLRQQIAQWQNDGEDLSNRLAEANDAKKLSDEQFNELLRLRGEVGMLRRQTNEIGQLQAALQRSLQAGEAHQSGYDNSSASNQQRQMSYAKMDDSRDLLLDFIEYANDHQGQFPTNYDEISSYTNHYSMTGTNSFEIVYQGSWSALTNPGNVIVLQESQAWPTIDGKWAKAYGFADGHSEIHVTPARNFDAFEQRHSTSPPASGQ